MAASRLRTGLIAGFATALVGGAALAGYFLPSPFSPRAPLADWEAGWEWMVRSDVARQTDQDFDYDSGEIVNPDGPTLELPGGPETPIATIEAEVVQRICESYVNEDTQKVQVWLYIWSTRDEAASRLPDRSPELVEASERISARLDEEVGPLYRIDGERVTQYDSILERRDALEDEYWALESQEVRDEMTDLNGLASETWDSIYSDEGILQAQLTLVDKCDITVPEGYQFPDAAELEIDLTNRYDE